MTRAEKSPVKRIVRGGAFREYVVEVRADLVLVRPLRARKGGNAEIAMSWDRVYITGYMPKKRKPRRGVLKA